MLKGLLFALSSLLFALCFFLSIFADMKRFILFAWAVLCLAGCSSDESDTPIPEGEGKVVIN